MSERSEGDVRLERRIELEEHMVIRDSFERLSKNVATDFLQTVVVLDDYAAIAESPMVERLVDPDELPVQASYKGSSGASIRSGRRANALDIQELITSFASHGLVCAVLEPWRKTTSETQPAVTASLRADIVILDWHLGDRGEIALGIIRDLLDADMKAGGRLRMIVVYTASRRLTDIRDTVRQSLSDFSRIDERQDLIALASQHARILFIQKSTESRSGFEVSEKDLPERLIGEFAEMAKGILPNVALGGIAAIRNATHHLLARFHRGLDAPFLTHRIMQVVAENAENYATDLLVSELQSILEESMVGTKYADRNAIELALTERESQQDGFLLRYCHNSDSVPISLNDLLALVNGGLSALKELNDIGLSKRKRKQLERCLYLVFSKDTSKGRSAHLEFARTSTHGS